MLVAWITAAAGVIAAITGIALWLSERDRNNVLRRQQRTLEDQLNEARAIRAQRKAVDLHILSLREAGGGGTYVDFYAEVANYGEQPCRCNISAEVHGEAVDCNPETLDLTAAGGPQLVRVLVPRPRLGDLMKECNDETTLYGETLRIRADAEIEAVEESWHEHIYDEATQRDRHEIQQRYWRMGHGEETEADLRAEHLAERIRKRDESDGPELYDV